MNKLDGGSILIDAIIALFILSITLVSVYGLLIKAINYETKHIILVEILLNENEEYEKDFETTINR